MADPRALALIVSLAASGLAQDLTQFSLEGLMNIQVTSVSKKKQRLAGTAAAAYVITQEDIRHSGMTNIPDLLRMVPGVDVARIDAHSWAISIRGFNFRYATKVLVLIDGRAVYTPAFSGVFWDQQDVPLDDIERIEVIRGPGGTVWGANAMNGVINIITKSSLDTQGGLVTAGSGSEDSVQGLAQYGGKAGKNGTYRVFGRYFNVENSIAANRTAAGDSWHGSHVGFRSDWTLSRRDTLTVQGDLYGTSGSQTVTSLLSNQLPDLRTFNDTVKVGSGNILGRWRHTFSNGSETSLQVYYDRFRRNDVGTNILNTGDADFQYHFQIGSRNDIVAGAGYRVTDDVFREGYSIALGTGQRRDQLVNTFFQDEVKLTNTVALTLGSKFEHNDYTGFEFEPSVQLMWTPSLRQTVWASASRAIRQPPWYAAESRLDAATFLLPDGGFAVAVALGNPDAEAERMLDFEAGYRTQLNNRVSLDVTAFHSRYSRLESVEPGMPYFTLSPAPPHLVIPRTIASLANANNYGGEAFVNWNVTSRWRLSPGFSFLQMKIGLDPASHDTLAQQAMGYSPKQQAQLRSTVNLPHNLEWDTSVYYVGSLAYGPIPSYTRLDTRVGWRAGEAVEFSVAGQNLLSPRRFEFMDGFQVRPTQVERSVVGKVSWHF